MINLEKIGVHLPQGYLFSDISLQINKGDKIGLVGKNGAGKSTLFKAILGLIEVSAGEVKVNKLPIETQRKEVVYVPQKTEVDWNFPATVMDVVLMGRYPHKKVFSRLALQGGRMINIIRYTIKIKPIKLYQLILL